MTVLEDRIAMAESDNTRQLDEMFERLEKMPVPEGYKVEIVEGTIYMSPQRDAHWQTIRRIVRELDNHFGDDVHVVSDVRIDFPGPLNGYCPDVAKLRDDAEKDARDHWRYEDIEFIAEVISTDTARNDYGPKKTAYALAEVPVYLIADPCVGKCRLFTQPKDGDYISDLSITYGGDVDMTTTLLGLVLPTATFPRG
ncbi:Uma2 family endonuclease [Streptomyces stelliscabiei]|uniref:Uma2 family endonuclease n=1 Tax=Streptomyces stelliscabiei TaxID=146820 RepID=UPI00299FD23A|nr:Uma2 family endonuclease [Streptomyces stelliscabiei]MDX2555861.1 Uma2 family endonuclease [Streptomyces stelliscabiei]MDX2616466.1 Uma2 family endonuclease [Streptomyces stelliscabiei]MDX2641260.1 Uma2 family endonuclease [Streptomyces stelliscabiei]MDX2665974.1 Uma2 family endonuclease [Streptomyces stelliscabiei]MDX2716453.1 Uma2 family endonuclease [Streptomyces stelliscabiei]